ncbi:hypothetical protein BDN67DRAFT_1012200 [Paxillus ammoniavirescens]|nr:hypothetical protein BDN67DRAFT_1012200 [Paxillus ammoniavirescens]
MVSTRRLTRGTYPQSHHLPTHQHHLSQHLHHHHLTTPNDETTSTPRGRTKRLHDPGGQTDTPDSVPPSVQLEGEKIRPSSLYVEADHIKTDDHEVEVDHETQKPPRGPVGTQHGDMRCPNEPTEPPDEEEGARRGNGDMKVDRRPGGRGVEETKSREVEDELGGTDEDDDCQRDGRTNNTDAAMSSTSCDSLRVETGALADDEASQQCNATYSPPQSTTLPWTPQADTYKRQQARAYGVRTMSNSRVDNHPDQPDVTETASQQLIAAASNYAKTVKHARKSQIQLEGQRQRIVAASASNLALGTVNKSPSLSDDPDIDRRLVE